MTIILTEEAKQDIIEITNYTIDKWGYQQAAKYNDEIESAYQTLLEDSYTLLSKYRDDLKINFKYPYCCIICNKEIKTFTQ